MGDKAVYVNVYPFIWNQFRNAGYVTGKLIDNYYCLLFNTFVFSLFLLFTFPVPILFVCA